MPNKIDIRRALAVDGLLGTGLIGDQVLSQPVIDKLVTQLVEYNNPVRINFPRKKGSGYAWHLNRRTVLGAAGDEGAAAGNTYYAFTADTNTFDNFEGTGTYAQHDFIYRTIGAQGKVTRKSQAIGQSYSNILADELEAKAMEYRDKEDWSMIWSCNNPGGGTVIGHNANGFEGIYHLCADVNRKAGANATGASGPSGGTSLLTLDLLDEAMDAIRGDCNMIITSKKGRRIVNSLLQQQQRFNDKITVKGGFKVLSYNDVPIFTTTNIPDTGGLDVDYYSSAYPGLTGLSGGNMSSIFMVDTSKVFMGVLTEITVQPLAKSTSQYDVFDIYCDEAVVVRDPKAISVIHFSAGSVAG